MFISRVVSLIPSATETVVDFGLGNCIVGISHEVKFFCGPFSLWKND